MECYTYLRNVTDLLSDGKTPYERRFGQPFEGPTMPYGSLVECHPKTCERSVPNPSIWKESLLGLFLNAKEVVGVGLLSVVPISEPGRTQVGKRLSRKRSVRLFVCSFWWPCCRGAREATFLDENGVGNSCCSPQLFHRKPESQFGSDRQNTGISSIGSVGPSRASSWVS